MTRARRKPFESLATKDFKRSTMNPIVIKARLINSCQFIRQVKKNYEQMWLKIRKNLRTDSPNSKFAGSLKKYMLHSALIG